MHSVWDLHSKIFQNYFDWCKHVGLPRRPTSQSERFRNKEPFTDEIIIMLMNELALFYCIWTEGANVRYMPEVLCFIFWTMRFSPFFTELDGCGNGQQGKGVGEFIPVPVDPDLDVRNLRQEREELRKKYWAFIATRKSRMMSDVTPVDVMKKAGVDLNQVHLLVEIIVNGDGGQFTDAVIQPIFNFLAHELDHLGGKKGVESMIRINYDDVNESMTNPRIIERTLKKLGVSSSQSREINDAYERICDLPYQKTDDGESVYDYEELDCLAAECALCMQSLYGFEGFGMTSCLVTGPTTDVEKMDDEEKVVCEGITGFIAAHSSVLLTHVFLQALERLAAGYLSSPVKDPGERRAEKVRWRHRNYTDLEAPEKEDTPDEPEDKKKRRKKKATQGNPSVPMEGQPFGVYLTGLIWLGIFFAMLGIFVLQFLKPESIGVSGIDGSAFEFYWRFVSALYFTVMVITSIASTRDGYAVSLSDMVTCGWWPLGKYSVRGKPRNEIKSNMQTSWRVFFWNMGFWTIVLAIKIAFDYIFIISPLALSLKSLSTEGWLASFFPNGVYILGTSINVPSDGDFLLMIVRCIPSFLVVLVDTSVFYMLAAVAFGMIRGVVLLNLGVVGNWSEVQREFRSVPHRWWEKCISPDGRKNIKEKLAKTRTLLPLEDVFPIPDMDQVEESSKKKGRKGREKKATKGKKKQQPPGEEVYDVFADTWNRIVADLRDADLISNKELDNLQFLKMGWHESLYKHHVKPLMQPVFVYAGQLEKVTEVPRPTPAHMHIITETRDILLWLAGQLGLLDMQTCENARNIFFLGEPYDRHHRMSRRELLKSVKGLLVAFQDASKATSDTVDTQPTRIALENVLKGLINERDALKDYKGSKYLRLGQKYMNDNISILEMLCKTIRSQVLGKPGVLLSSLQRIVKDRNDNGEGEYQVAIDEVEDVFVNDQLAPRSLMVKFINGLLRRMNTTRVAASPSGREARQFLTFFVTSLFNPMLRAPPPLVQMLSWTTLVPVFEEDVVYAIEASETAGVVGVDPPRKGMAKITDLLSETHTRLPLLSYLRTVYPKDWMNFLERMRTKYGVEFEDPKSVTGEEFLQEGDFHHLQNDLLLWASYRGQLLARTVRGMMAYENALKLICLLEHPRNETVPEDEYELMIEELVAAKFRCVVAAQVYGRNKRSRQLKHRWDARAIEMLCCRHPTLRVSYLDVETREDEYVQYAVLIRGAGVSFFDGPEHPNPSQDKYNVEEVYRLRLPQNRFTARGVIIGEGKPENQNHAIPFAFGECLQTIDMNQDNFLLEAMKMRNLLDELTYPEYIPSEASAPKTCYKYQSNLKKRLERKMVHIPILVGFREWIFSQKAGALGSFAAGTEFAFGTILQRTMTFPGRARFHYGHPDVWNKVWIMTRGGISKATRNLHVSEDVFGGFNAGLRGGKVTYRDYISVGKGRDMSFVSINGFEIKISGGNGEVCISRDAYRLGTRTDFFRMMSIYYSGPGFFINNAILMTTVYVQIWVLAVLALAGGYLVEREVDLAEEERLRQVELGLRDPDDFGRRLLAFEENAVAGRELLQGVYDYSGVSNAAGSFYEDPYADAPPPPAPPADTPPPPPSYGYYDYAEPAASGSNDDGNANNDNVSGNNNNINNNNSNNSNNNNNNIPRNATTVVQAVDTAVEITSIVQLGMLTVIAYIGELLLELGLLQTAAVILLQVISGSLSFFIFKQQTDAAAFVEDMNYGGARYVGTGREFALTHNAFVSLYARYARSHLYFATKLVMLCVMLGVLDIPGYGFATFGSWMVAISLVTAPFWFNPVQFVMSQTKADYKQWVRWMEGEERDPDSKLTWYTWHDKMMSKIRNESANMTDHWLNGAKAIISNLFTNGLLAIAAISQIETEKDKNAIYLWAAVSLALSVVVAMSVLLQTCFHQREQATATRVFRMLPALFFFIATIVLAEANIGAKTDDGKIGLKNLLLIYYANLQIIIFGIQVMQRTMQDRIGVRHAVDQAYYLLDYFLGVIFFGVLFVFSFTGIMNIIQNTLLFSVTFASSIRNKELVDAIGYDRDTERDDASKPGNRPTERTLAERFQRLTDCGSPLGSPRGIAHREGTFNTTSAWRGVASVENSMRASSFTAGLPRGQRDSSDMVSWTSMPPAAKSEANDGLSIMEVLAINEGRNEDEKQILL
ncbi:unnamed protein product [Ostreobium quekettii]|uniref:1,3-beta-glucan synthase n=1 Tax=Ostreobium quekettii TaxID=121088 RepID=A0A8S1IXX7_9CHLO|nr:unnamed protein product [Ostreobium quekettii]